MTRLDAVAKKEAEAPAEQRTIESLNARYRLAIKARGHFPTEQTAWVQEDDATPAITTGL